jgi:hypothetical protein
MIILIATLFLKRFKIDIKETSKMKDMGISSISIIVILILPKKKKKKQESKLVLTVFDLFIFIFIGGYAIFLIFIL